MITNIEFLQELISTLEYDVANNTVQVEILTLAAADCQNKVNISNEKLLLAQALLAREQSETQPE